MVENSNPSIQIDLNEFKLRLQFKNKTPLTLHFDSSSRRFYLSLIALVVHEMKILGKIKSIRLEGHFDLLVLLNETIGGAAGSSDKVNLLHRIYRKWKDALPNLEEAPLFKVLGRKKEEADGAIGKIYSFTDTEKDGWANLFEYMGSEENVRLKFAIDKIGAGLDEAEIIFGDFRNGNAWEQFIAGLKNGRQEKTVALVDRMKYPLPDLPSISVLPFVNLSDNPKQEFFRDGITEIPHMFVIPRVPKETSPIDYTQPQSYTPPKPLAEKILTTRHAMESERKLVTVFFAELANFTSFSEKLEPEEVHQIMEEGLRLLMDEIHKYEGTINQFTGHGVMVLFGAPLTHEDHAQRACYAALAIQKDLAEYSEKVKKDYGQEFKMRIGLNSGPVVVGSIGDDLNMVYMAIGDTLNLASRMGSQAQPGTVLLSRNTQRLVKDYFDLKSLGPWEVKDQEELQETFELVKVGGVATKLEASLARGLTRFVGREKSMASLMETYEKVRAGAGQVVGMVGEAGVGKSRLLLEFRQRLPQEQFGYLEGHCIHFGGAMPYLPILEILRSFFEVREGEREVVIRKRVRERVLQLDQKLQGIIPPIQDLLSLKVEDEAYLKLEPKQRREKVFEALRDLFIRESQERPLILVKEDLHWIDKTSEEFLDYFIDGLASVKVLLILLHRPEYTPLWGSKSYFNRIGVDQLTLKASAKLVKAVLGGGETTPELSNLILNRTAGNPLFMEELTHSLLENGSIQKTGDQYVINSKASDIQVPDTIQGIIASRMDRLEENLKRIVQVASVIGREFAFRILQAISEMRKDLKSQLLNLQGLELIYEKSLFPEIEYVFKHALTQEVAYNSLLLKRRKEIHEKTGRAIEELYPERLEEFYEMLAYHYGRGENFKKASDYLKLSGSKAARNHSLWEAYSLYKEALSTLHRLPETVENKKEKLEVIVLMVTPMTLLGFPEGSLEMLQEGESYSKDLQDNKRLAFFHSTLSDYYSVSGGNHLLGMKYSEEALEESRKCQDIDMIVPITLGLCIPYVGTGNYGKVVDMVPGVLDLLEKTARKSDFFSMYVNPYSHLCGFCGMSMGYLGDFDEGKIVLEKGLRQAAQIDNLRTLVIVEGTYGFLFHTKGDWKPAIEHLQNSIKYGEAVKFLSPVAITCAHLGSAYSFLGDTETGRRYVEKGLKIQLDAGLEWGSPWFYLYLGDIHLQLGDLKNARSSVDEALKLSQKNNEKSLEGFSWMTLGRILGRTEIPQIYKCEEYISHGMKIFDELKIKPYYALSYFYLGELYADAEYKEKALEHLRKAEGQFQEMGMDYWLNRTREVLQTVR